MNKKIKLVQRLEVIKDYCKGKRVLHLGCANSPYTQSSIADGSNLHFLLEQVASELYGFDFDDEGLEIMTAHGATNLFKADLEHLEDAELETTFDVIVAGEMIEHLNNPGLFLSGIKRFMNADTKLVITTLSAYFAMRFLRYGFTRDHGRNEPVHPDHVAYYSYSTLNLLLDRHSLEIEDFMFYDLGLEHRTVTPFIFRLINDVCVRIAPQWADGLIAVCRLPKPVMEEPAIPT